MARTTATKMRTGASAPSIRKMICAAQSNGLALGPSHMPVSAPSASPSKSANTGASPPTSGELPEGRSSGTGAASDILDSYYVAVMKEDEKSRIVSARRGAASTFRDRRGTRC